MSEVNAMIKGYSIKVASELTGITEDTIRYYEKIGLLPRAQRKGNSHRVYSDGDIETMKLITCLKKRECPWMICGHILTCRWIPILLNTRSCMQ